MNCTFDVKQTREKYKRCVQIWRESVIKLKIKMGIKRFQKEEDIMSHPSQSIEQSNIEDVEATEFTSDSATDSSYSSSTTKESENKKMIFVPA